jgi:ABC-2 type transport system permease protein
MNAIPLHPTTVPAPDPRILPAVWKLLILRVRITFNGFRHAKIGRKIGIIVLWLLILGFAVFLFMMSKFLLDFLASPDLAQYVQMDIQPFMRMIPALTLTALFMGILLTSFGVLLQALYLSGDMDFLLASPVPIRAVFVAKMLQAILPNFALICLFGLPTLYGLGGSLGYNFLFYPLVLLVMILLALAAAGISALLVMLVVRILPPRRAAEILGFIGAIFGFTCSQMGNLANAYGDHANVTGAQVSGVMMAASTPWLPLNWAGRGLVAIGESHWLEGLGLVILTLGISAVVFWVSLNTAERWYYTGWAGMQVVTTKKKTLRTPRPIQAEASSASMGFLSRLLSAPVLGIVQKDFVTLWRDLRNLSQLITPLIMGVIYSFILFRNAGEIPAGRGEAPNWFMDSMRLVLAYGNVGMSLFVGWTLLSRLAGMGFSHEGKSYWMLKVAPVRSSQLLVAKFLVAYLPTVGLGLIFLVGISLIQGMSAVDFLYGLVAMLLCQAGMAGILLAFGAVGANFTWDDPRKINAGSMGCLGQLVTMLFLPISFFLFIAPLGLVSFLNLPLVYGYLIGLLIGGSVSLGCAIVPPWLVRKRVERLSE